MELVTLASTHPNSMIQLEPIHKDYASKDKEDSGRACFIDIISLDSLDRP